MTPEQLAALVADHKRISKHHAGTQMGSRSANTADAIEHLQAEVARLSTPPDDAEVAALVAELGEPLVIIEGYSADYVDTNDVRERMGKAADHLTRLSHALAAEKAKREAMEEARDVDLLFDAYKGLLVLFRVLDTAGLTAGVEATIQLADAIVAAHPEFPARTALRATLAKHGSK